MNKMMHVLRLNDIVGESTKETDHLKFFQHSLHTNATNTTHVRTLMMAGDTSKEELRKLVPPQMEPLLQVGCVLNATPGCLNVFWHGIPVLASISKLLPSLQRHSACNAGQSFVRPATLCFWL